MAERFKLVSGPVDAVAKQLNEYGDQFYKPVPGCLAKEPHGGPVTILMEKDYEAERMMAVFKAFGGDVNKKHLGVMYGVDDTKGDVQPVPAGDAGSDAVASHEGKNVPAPDPSGVPAADPDVVKALGGKNQEGAANVKEPELEPAVGSKDASPHGKAHAAGKHVGHDKGSVVGQKKK